MKEKKRKEGKRKKNQKNEKKEEFRVCLFFFLAKRRRKQLSNKYLRFFLFLKIYRKSHGVPKQGHAYLVGRYLVGKTTR